MAGRKLFTNATPHRLAVTLKVRVSEDPRNSAGTKAFFLDPRESQWQEYGNNIDIYLNGIDVVAQGADGVAIVQQHTVITRGSPLDDRFNMHNGVDFTLVDGVLQVSTRQVM